MLKNNPDNKESSMEAKIKYADQLGNKYADQLGKERFDDEEDKFCPLLREITNQRQASHFNESMITMPDLASKDNVSVDEEDNNSNINNFLLDAKELEDAFIVLESPLSIGAPPVQIISNVQDKIEDEEKLSSKSDEDDCAVINKEELEEDDYYETDTNEGVIVDMKKR